MRHNQTIHLPLVTEPLKEGFNTWNLALKVKPQLLKHHQHHTDAIECKNYESLHLSRSVHLGQTWHKEHKCKQVEQLT